SYNVPQNGFKFLRTADDYGTWLAGPDSGQSIHGFAPPGPLRRCQDCHNAHGGGVQAFRRSGDPADPPERPNAPVTVDLLALRRQATVPGAPEELIAPLDRSAPRLEPGETVT